REQRLQARGGERGSVALVPPLVVELELVARRLGTRERRTCEPAGRRRERQAHHGATPSARSADSSARVAPSHSACCAQGSRSSSRLGECAASSERAASRCGSLRNDSWSESERSLFCCFSSARARWCNTQSACSDTLGMAERVEQPWSHPASKRQ